LGESTGESAGTPAGGARTPEEQGEQLEGRLQESLSEFDRLLLREQEKLAERAASAPPAGMPGGSEGGGGSAGGYGSEGGGGESASEGTAGAAGDEDTSGDSTDFATAEAPAHRAGGEVDGDEDPGRGDRVPADVGDGNDDDIVARQLREAAMAEQDPELREKLWEEYRAYKGLPAKRGATEAGDDD
jgi:hypothetical protein